VRKFIKTKKGGIVEMNDGVEVEVSSKKREMLLTRLADLK